MTKGKDRWKEHVSGRRTRPFGRKLRNQLVLVFVVTISMAMGFVFITTYRQSQKLLTEQSASITGQFFEQNEYNLKTFMDEIDKAAKLLIVLPELQEYLGRGWSNDFDTIMMAREIFNYTASIMRNNENIVSVFYYGTDGVSLGITDRGNYVLPKNTGALDYFNMGIEERVRQDVTKMHWIGGFTSSDFYLLTPEDPEGLTAEACVTAARSLNYSGRHRGTLIINVRERAFADLITKSDAGGLRCSYIINGDGEFVIHKDTESIGNISDVLPEDIQDETDAYIIRDGIQVNFSLLSDTRWYMISEVSLDTVYMDIYTLRNWFIFIFIIAIIAAISISMYWMYRLMRPLDELRLAMGRMEQGEVGEQLDETSQNELGLLGRQFNKMSKSISELIVQIKTVENEKRNMELEALKMQINPHFLFNTLSNIKYMAMIIQSKTITEAVTALGNMLRPMYKSDSEFWPLDEEIDFLENYIKIMNYRFGNGIRVNYHIPEELGRTGILKFVLQPIIENAITHGFDQSGGMGTITIDVCQKDGGNAAPGLRVTVADDGQGMDMAMLTELREQLADCESYGLLRKGHIGIVNVHRRLQIYFGSEYGITVESACGKGTTVTMLLKVIS